jgi:hypothetical protein
MEASQLIILIILIVIGIVLFVVLLVELVNIPSPLITPFADGSIVRIKSLANNLYLKPVSCSDLASCNNDYVGGLCDVEGGIDTIVVAIGQANDPLVRWQLCQYSALSDTGQAKYVLFSESSQDISALSFFSNNNSLTSTAFLNPAGGVCTQIRSQQPNCAGGQVIRQHFSFVLNERAAGNNTTSGSYNIASSCDFGNGDGFLFSDGIGAITLPLPDTGVCPPLVLTQSSGGSTINCTEPNVDAGCSLNYLFEVEVVS